MSGWIDKLDKGKRVAESRLRFGQHTLIVHRHIDYPPDTWLFSCHSLGESKIELPGAVTQEEAKSAAVDYVRDLLETALTALNGVVKP